LANISSIYLKENNILIPLHLDIPILTKYNKGFRSVRFYIPRHYHKEVAFNEMITLSTCSDIKDKLHQFCGFSGSLKLKPDLLLHLKSYLELFDCCFQLLFIRTIQIMLLDWNPIYNVIKFLAINLN